MAYSTDHLHLAVALDGAGWPPTAWREPAARPAELFTARYWVDVIQEAERGLLDFVTLEDGLRLQSDHPFVSDERTDRVRGRLDAVLIAARVAPTTRGIGIVPAATVTHTEPFHQSKAIATIDFVTSGRAGIEVQISTRDDEARHFGRRSFPTIQPGDPATRQLTHDLFEEAADYVEVLRRLWDSWEDDAEIRNVATGRFVDRAKLHYIRFEGRSFSVKGPSITPRPPQGQPIVSTLAHSTVAYQLIARSADVGFVTPRTSAQATEIIGEIRDHQAAAGRSDDTIHVFADLVVFLDESRPAATDRKQRLDDLAGREYTSDATIFTGTPAELADLLQDWASSGLTGFRLRPAAIPHDLAQISRGLVPELQRRGLFRTSYEASTLRGLLGLPRPANRYTASAV